MLVVAAIAFASLGAHAMGTDIAGLAAMAGLDPQAAGLGLAGLAMMGQLQTVDAQTIDSTGVFFTNQLQRIDPVLNEPMAEFTWSRDISLAPLDIADENTGFDSVKFAAVGGVQPAGKSFIGTKTTEIGNVSADFERKLNPTFLWAEAIQVNIVELAKSAKLGRNLDGTLLDSLNMKKNLDTQNMVYLGDATYGVRGLVNQTIVTAVTVANGASASPLWTSKTDDEVLQDVNTQLVAAWAATGYTMMPTRVGLPPAKLAYLVSRKIANGSMSLAKFLSENSIAVTQNGAPLQLVPMRELIGAGTGGTDRMVFYTNDRKNLRFPMSATASTAVQYRDLFQRTVYYLRMGVVEIVRPETLRYADGF
jgi:hypothetical protein